MNQLVDRGTLVKEGEGCATEDMRDLAEHSSNPFGMFRDFNVEQFFNDEGVAQFIWAFTCGNVVETMKVG